MAGSILEVFSILFESDAKDVKKGAEDAQAATDNLEDKIQETDASTEKLGESFVDLAGSAKTALVGLVGVGAITAGLLNFATQADELGKFSQALGLNVGEVDAWSEAVVRFGGTSQSLQGSISSLTGQLTDFALTGGGAAGEVFARLGIQAFDSAGNIKSAFDVLPEIAEAFEGLTAAEAVGFGQKLGLDQGTILLLQQGRREVDEIIRRQKSLGVTTEENAAVAADFNDAWADFSQRTSNQFRRFASVVLPIFTRLLNGVDDFVDFLKENRTIVEGFFIGVAGVLTIAYLPAILSVAAATIAAIAPFLAIGAAVAAVGAAFALIYEDVVAFQNGQDSLIGTIIEKYPIVGQAVTFISDAFSTLIDIGAQLFDIFVKIFTWDFKGALDGILGLFSTEFKDALIGDFEAIETFITETFESIKQFVLGVFDAIGEKFADVIPDVGGLLGGARDLFGSVFGMDDDLSATMQQGASAINQAQNNALAGQTSNSLSTSNSTANRNTHVSVGTVAVDARGGNSQDVASNVGTALSDQLKQAVSDFDDGVFA